MPGTVYVRLSKKFTKYIIHKKRLFREDLKEKKAPSEHANTRKAILFFSVFFFNSGGMVERRTAAVP